MFENTDEFLLRDWMLPVRLEDLAGKAVLECGCGGGGHTQILARYAETVTAVDLNTSEIARTRCKDNGNVSFVEADLGTMELGRQFDVVVCIGVIHHTDDPDRTFETLYRHCRPGGMVVIWTYSAEGNAMVRFGVEPVRKLLLSRLSRRALVLLSQAVTALLYPIVHTIYRIPGLSFLPYYQYFANFRRMSFHRNMLNVFDKLNAPQTHFTTLEKTRQWMSADRFVPGSVSVLPYVGVSYSLVGTKQGGRSE